MEWNGFFGRSMMIGNGSRVAFGEIDFHIKGITQHVQHSGRSANPMDHFARAMKEITAKKKKTDEDHEELLRLKWQSACYLNKAGQFIIPPRVLEGAYVEAGRRSKEGKNIQAALWSPAGADDWKLEFPGSDRTSEEIMNDSQHFLVSRVGVNNRTVMTARPCFPEWSLKYKIRFYTDIFNHRDVIGFTEVLGNLIGLSDDRAIRGGRFEIVEAKEMA